MQVRHTLFKERREHIMKQKKWMSVILLAALCTAAVTGCGNKEATAVTANAIAEASICNKAFDAYDKEVKELGVVVQAPSETELNELSRLETYEINPSSETVLIVPKYNGSNITVSEVTSDEKGNLIMGNVLYEKEDTTDYYGLRLDALKSEGVPAAAVTIRYGDTSSTYYLAASGKASEEKTTYLKPDVKEEAVLEESAEQVTVAALADENYLANMNLVKETNIDVDGDGSPEKVQAYTTALVEEGVVMADDSQEYAIVVEKEGKRYPLSERGFIQLGTIDYRAYEDFEQSAKAHIMVETYTTAELKIIDFTYDATEDTFVGEVLCEKNNINNLN